ncbi:hypothetical protein RYA05_01815 [Pseudomonas syringae pv. actinidiae]|nr:hypothetical protein [Pseudomonas syringae pv. actinidiae]
MNTEHLSQISTMLTRTGLYALVVGLSEITARECEEGFANNHEAVIHRDNKSLQRSVTLMHMAQGERPQSKILSDEDRKYIAEMLRWYGVYELARALLRIEVDNKPCESMESAENYGVSDVFLLGTAIASMKNNHFLRLIGD